MDNASLQGLISDIAERGLRTPIEVKELPKGGYILVSGLRRLEACRYLGWAEMPAFVIDGDDLALKRDELLDNLTRDEFSKLNRALAIAELKRIHQELHPETRHGGDRRSQEFQDAKMASWFSDLTNLTGLDERTLKRSVSIGERLSSDIAHKLHNTDIANHQAALELLARHEPDQQEEAVSRLLDGAEDDDASVPRLKTILKEIGTNGASAPTLSDPEEALIQQIVDRWNRLGHSGRDRVLARIGAV